MSRVGFNRRVSIERGKSQFSILHPPPSPRTPLSPHVRVIGATDRTGGEAAARPVSFGGVYATLFRHTGIDGGLVTLNDLNGRARTWSKTMPKRYLMQ